MSNGFFINQNLNPSSGGGENSSLINIDGNKVNVNMPLDLYVDENNKVFAGSNNNNAMLMYSPDNKLYVRKVV